MTVGQAVVLGIVQGLTEFLPVSSSAHLVMMQYAMGLKGPSLLVFDVVVHAGTLTAVLIYFAKDLFPYPKVGGRVLGMIVLATIPTAVVGFSMKEAIEPLFTSLRPVAAALVFNSLMLWSLRWIRSAQTRETPAWLHSIWIGVVQGLAIIPGISRSGATIAAGQWFRMKPEAAFRFSFFLAIPAILGAMVIVLPEAVGTIAGGTWPMMASGFLAALGSGYIAISVVYRLVIKGRFHIFAVYTMSLALVSFIFSLTAP